MSEHEQEDQVGAEPQPPGEPPAPPAELPPPPASPPLVPPQPEQQPEPEAPAPIRKTVEQWAELKGQLPAFTVAPARLGRFEAERQRANPRHVEFAAAKAMHRWPEGKELTEIEYDAAIAAANTFTVR